MLRRLLLATLACLPAAAQAPPDAPLLTVTADVQLDPGVVYGGLVIAAGGVRVDGRGARIVGPVQRAAEAAGAPAAPSAFTGIGVRAAGVDGVTLRNLRVQGFALGLLLEDAAGWQVQDCDFSDNFHDPDFGWGEQPDRGGLLLRRVRRSVLRHNRANRTWDACSLVDCEALELDDNDFSRSSNTCLKLWHVTASRFRGNDLSWGLRIAPGEVHARDSTGVLIESGSDGNRFEDNDATHGGDGFFIRVLNNWPSRGNVFLRNDASWANNNGFEAWSPGNTYVGNRANHCSYGFWLGASDETVLLGNEAGWNGDPDGFHNAPEAFGHGGIVFVNGPSHHTVVDGNWLHHNAGGGLVLRGDEASGGAEWRAFHWVVQRNRLEANRWGVWMRHAELVQLGPDTFRDNRERDVLDAGGVTRLLRRDGPPPAGLEGRQAPAVEVRPARPTVAPGQRIELRAVAHDAQAPLELHWDLGDGTLADGPQVGHAWERPGFYRVALTADDGVLAGLASAQVNVVAPDELPASADGAAARWELAAADGSRATFASAPGLLGEAVHARIEPYGGGRVELLWPATRDAGQALAGATRLDVWLRARNPAIPAWQGPNPVVTLHQDGARWLRLVPARDLLAQPPDVHFRDGWMPLEVPLDGDPGWTAETGPGGRPERLEWLTLGVDGWGAPPLDLWLDALAVR